MVNPWDWNCEDSGAEIKSTTLVKAFQFKRDYGITTRSKAGIPLNVKMEVSRFDIDSSNGLLYNSLLKTKKKVFV